MKAIAGSIVILGGCVLLSAVAAHELHDFAVPLSGMILALGLCMTIRGWRHPA